MSKNKKMSWEDFRIAKLLREGKSVKVIFLPENRIEKIEGKLRAGELLKKLDLNPEEYLIVREGQILTRDVVLQKEDEVKIIPVVSGGE